MDHLFNVLIVDPIVSPQYLADRLKAKQCKLIALYTLNLSAEERRLRFHPELFDQVFYLKHDDELPKLIQQLSLIKLDFILYGYEHSVHLTDLIAAKLNFPGRNPLETSSYRSDKYAMNLALEKAGMQYAKQLRIKNKTLSEDEQKLLNSWQGPWVIKPVNGAGSLGMQLIENLDQLHNYLSHPSLIWAGAELNEFVLQEYFTGTEYYVDSFSANGKHHIISIACYEKFKLNGHAIYHTANSVTPESEEFKTCKNYVLKVLEAVQLYNGFGHTELFLTATGPHLIEINPRISGAYGLPNRMAELTIELSQPQALVNYLNHHMITEAHRHDAYGCLYFYEPKGPRTLGNLKEEKLQQLASYKEHIVLKTNGTKVNQPEYLSDCLCYVLLINKSEQLLNEDIERLNTMEANQDLFNEL